MRLEDRPLLTGRGRFAADISFPQQLHMRIVRSNFAHGNLRAIDADAALALPGVQAVWTAADVADIPPIDFRLTRIESLAAYRQTILARDRVRYVGDPVAVVFAENAYLAEDAAELVAVEIEQLPVGWLGPLRYTRDHRCGGGHRLVLCHQNQSIPVCPPPDSGGPQRPEEASPRRPQTLLPYCYRHSCNLAR